MTLLFKLVLVPGLIALVTMAGRRFGPRVGGWLNALPLVAGPVLFFLALEQGDQFVARAALSTLAGLAAVAAFAVIYSWVATRRPWWVCVLVGWTAFAARRCPKPKNSAPRGDTLVVIFMRGAADTLNIVVPHAEDRGDVLEPVVCENRIGDALGFEGPVPVQIPLVRQHVVLSGIGRGSAADMCSSCTPA